MLYAGSCLSELPISTTRTQIPNGDEYGFSFIIDQILDGEYEIDQVLCSVFTIDQLLENLYNMDTEVHFTLPIQRKLEYSQSLQPVMVFTLQIKAGNNFIMDSPNE